MSLEKNNNAGIIYRVAASNLKGSKLYSVFSILTITLAVTLVSTLALYLQSEETAKSRMLANMQHVMYERVSMEQLEQIKGDPRTEQMIPYKYTAQYNSQGIKYSLCYMESQKSGIHTYVPKEGRIPQEEDEVVVDKKFMDALGLKSKLGAEVTLDIDGRKRQFTICGYTEKDYNTSVFSVYVSKAFADSGQDMKDIPYTALTKLQDAEEMTASEFEHAVYQMAGDYGIDKTNVNINGKFEESLQKKNANLYTCIIIAMAVLAAGAVVIYSIFYLSVTARMQQIGQLQTIGMTQKQIKKMVRREGLLLCIPGVPAGLVVGGGIAYLLVPEGWSFTNYIITACLVAVFGLAAVQISIGKPASMAAKVSPIEASRNTGDNEKETQEKSVHKKLGPFTLARLEQGRDRKKWMLTTMSLAFGGLVFMTGACYVASWDADLYSRQSIFKDSEYYITYLYDAHNNPKPYGPTELQLNGHLDKELEEKLLDIPHVKKVKENHSAYANLELQGKQFGESFYEITEDSEKYLDIITEGENTYNYLAEHDSIVIFNSAFLEEFYGVSLHVNDKVKLSWFDGEEHTIEVEIAGISSESIEGESEISFMMSDRLMQKMWGTMNKTSSLNVAVENYEKYGDTIEQQMKDILDDYPDLMMTSLREQKIDDSSMIQRLNVKIYGIAAFIITFSILNLINTMVSSIASRQKELAMLEAIGMEYKQIKKMLRWESFFLALPNILLTLTLGTAAGYAVVAVVDHIGGFLDFHFPLYATVLYVIGMIAMPMLISALCLKEQGRIALVERT